MKLSEGKAQGLFGSEEDYEKARALLRSESTGDESTAPWIARLALGLGAWLAGVFFIGFVWLVLDLMGLDEELVVSGVGLFLVGGSVYLLGYRKSLFLEQLALALSLAGHLLFFFGLHDVVPRNEFAGPLFGAVLLAGPVYWFSRNAVQRYLSVGWVWLTWWAAAMDFWSGDSKDVVVLGLLLMAFAVVVSLLWGFEKLANPIWRPILWSSLTSQIFSLFWLGQFSEWIPLDFSVERLFGVVAGFTWSVLLWRLIRPEGPARFALLAFALLLVGLGLAGAAGVVFSLGLLAVAHARRERMLEAAAIASLGVFLIVFYYHLGVPLNEKAFLMMGAGAVLLGIRYWLGRHSPEAAEGGAR